MIIIYLEPDEEITSVVDRLKSIPETDVALVVPKRAGLLQSVINLKLLRFQSEQLKKHLSIVTTDKTGRNLASAVGLTVYQKLPEGSEVAGKTTPSDTTPAPIVIKENASKKSRTAPITSDGIRMKRKPEALPTRPVGGSAPDPAPVAAAPTAASAAASEAPSAPSTQGPQKPRPSRRSLASRMPRLPQISRPVLGRRSAIAGIIGALLLALFFIPTFLFASATVNVSVKSTPVEAEIPIVFSARSQSVDAVANIIPAKTIQISRDSTVEAPATGQRQGGDRATGTITISNRLAAPQSLVARTRFVTADGKVYRIQSGIAVPGAGSTRATVVADEPGEAGNAPAGTALTLVAIPNSALTAVVETALTGPAATGGTQVSADDIEKAKAQLAQKAATEGMADAKGRVAVGFVLSDRAVSTTVGAVTASPPAGADAAQFVLSGNVSITYFTYEDSVLQKVVDEDLRTKLQPGQQLLDGKTGTFAPTQASGETVTGTYRVTAAAAADAAPEQLRALLAGKSLAEARTALRAKEAITSSSITVFPPWLQHLPGSEKRLKLKYQSSGTQASPPPSPTPSPSPLPSANPSPTLRPASGTAPTALPLPSAAPAL